MAGKSDYQCREFTNVNNPGPIPEGSWSVKQSDLQHFNDESLLQKLLPNYSNRRTNWTGD